VATIRSLTRDLSVRSAEIAELLRFRSLASAEEIADYQPGGAENADKGPMGVVFCYANMVRMCERLKTIPTRSASEREASESEIADALRGTPEAVTLSEPDADGNAITLNVYPKSYDCLDWLSIRDAQLSQLIEWRRLALERCTAVEPDLAEDVSAEIGYQYGLILVVITTEGPWLPWDMREPPKELPEVFQNINPADILRLHQAFVRVNQVRLAALDALISSGDKEGGGKRPSWLTFFAAQASEHGTEAKFIMRHRDLPSVIATALIAADLRKQASEPSGKTA